jgi:hypothetical protein
MTTKGPDMADRKGDTAKQPQDCRDLGVSKMACPNLKETGGGFEGERYRCEVCGESFFLDYDDMR